MEKLTTKADFIKMLENIKAVEVLARNEYIKDLANFKNSQITTTISQIKNDEDKHIMLLDELLNLLKK